MEKDKQKPGRKAKPGSAFHFFQLDRNENLPQQNDSTKKLNDNEAFKDWKELSAKDPEKVWKYMEKSKDMKTKKNQPDLKNRYDQSGRSLEKIKHDDQRKEEEKKNRQQFVENTVNDLHVKGKLTEHSFHIIFFNTTTPANGTQEGKHYPCEMGLVEYSIKNGLIKTFHMFVSPTEVPIGYRYEAIEKSKSTHNIPPDPEDFDKYEKNFNKIFKSIKNFVSAGNSSSAFLPLYVMPNHKEAAEFIIDFICEKAGEKEKVFRIFKLPQLVFQLLKVAPGGSSTDGENSAKINSEGAVSKLLDQEQFKYVPGLGCDFHEEVGNKTHHCALTIAKCLGFNMAQICSSPFNVRIQPGRHEPKSLDRTDALPAVSVKQAVTQETKNPWGTTISIHAAPAGVSSSIPNSFDPNQVKKGPGAELFPGLHPELNEQSQSEENSQDDSSHRGSLRRHKDVGTKPKKYYRRGFLVQPEEISQDLSSNQEYLSRPKHVSRQHEYKHVSRQPQYKHVSQQPQYKNVSQQPQYSHQGVLPHSKDVNQKPKHYSHGGSLQQQEYSHQGVLPHSEEVNQQAKYYSHRGSLQHSQNDVGSVKSGDIFYSAPNSPNSNDGTRRGEKNGSNSSPWREALDDISLKPEKEKIEENGKGKNAVSEKVREAVGRESEGRKEKKSLEIHPGNQVKDVNINMKNNKYEKFIRKDEKESDDKMKGNTKNVKETKISKDAGIQSSRAHFYRKDIAFSAGVKSGEKENMNSTKMYSGGHHDAMNDTVEERVIKIDEKHVNSNPKSEIYVASVEKAGGCKEDAIQVKSSRGKSVLKVGGNGVKSNVDTCSVLNGNDGVNSIGRGRGNVIRILGPATNRK